MTNHINISLPDLAFFVKMWGYMNHSTPQCQVKIVQINSLQNLTFCRL